MSENWSSGFGMAPKVLDLGADDPSLAGLDDAPSTHHEQSLNLAVGLDAFESDRPQEQVDFVSSGNDGGHPFRGSFPDADDHLQPDLTYGEEVHHVPDAWPDPELDPTQTATHLAAPIPDALETEAADYETVEDSRHWAGTDSSAIDLAPHSAAIDDFDDWAAGFNDELFALAAGLENPAAEMPVPEGQREAVFHVPYQLSGLSAFVPLPAQSPLRKFTLPRHLRRNGKGHLSADEDDEDNSRDPKNAGLAKT